MAGATCVQVGTQNFVTPTAAPNLVDELGPFLQKLGARSSRELVGTLKL
jgi:dihydroorotate dehydrogenase